MSRTQTLIDLIRNASTLSQAQSFLRDRGLPFSAQSWDALIEERLRPALRRSLTEADLFELLAEAEEYGRQHVFLYRRKGSKTSLPDERQLKRWLSGTPDEELLHGPRLLEYPEQPTIAEVRFELDSRIGTLSVKAIETRALVRLVQESELGQGRFTREYQRDLIRAVNVARLHSDGLLELRIFSHRTPGRSYADDLPAMWGLLSGLLDEADFSEWSLVGAKKALWRQRNDNSDRIRFSTASMRGTSGTTMSCRTGSISASLFDDEAAEESLMIFEKKGEAYCNAHNVWWIGQTNGLPAKDVHVLLSGADNEFAVTQQCTRDDYEHVLAEIRSIN